MPDPRPEVGRGPEEQKGLFVPVRRPPWDDALKDRLAIVLMRHHEYGETPEGVAQLDRDLHHIHLVRHGYAPTPAASIDVALRHSGLHGTATAMCDFTCLDDLVETINA